jgi:hypothetical protein
MAADVVDRERHTPTKMLMAAIAQNAKALQTVTNAVTITLTRTDRKAERAVRHTEPETFDTPGVGDPVTLQPASSFQTPRERCAVERADGSQETRIVNGPTALTRNHAHPEIRQDARRNYHT